MAKKSKQYLIEDTVIIDNIYPLVQASLPRKISSLKSCIERFVHARHDALYDYAPVDRIFFKKKDVDDFFRSVNIDQKLVSSFLPDLYYWKDEELQACKDEFSLTCLMSLRYLCKERPKDTSMIELVACYLAFSGKFYAGCHAKYWSLYLPKREVMDYVVNYMLSNKYDIVKTKSVWGSIRNLTMTWLERYQDELCGEITDERVTYLIHQLHNRISAFLNNIANAYYEAYNNKLYLNKESDNFDKENYRISNSNSTLISQITEKTMMYMVNSQVDLATCYNVSGAGVDPYDIKSIFETILNDNKKLDDLRYVINVMLVDFNNKYPEEKELTGAKFVAHSITMKPNTKDQNIIQMKSVILGWLNTSERYRKIKTQTTKNNYYKAILSYIAITINAANK